MAYTDFLKQQCYIDGEWVDADAGGTIEVTDPGTGKVLGTVPKMGQAETARAISVAADAVVVGSRLVQEIEAATPETAKEQLTRLVATLKAAIR